MIVENAVREVVAKSRANTEGLRKEEEFLELCPGPMAIVSALWARWKVGTIVEALRD